MSDYESATGFIAPAVEDLAPLFADYEIHSLIATGGMGAVYRAIQTSLAREVAIKILPVEFGSDAEYCASFEAEAKAMARLNHPNLIGVYDFGEVNGMPFIVMEFVPGQSLFHACHGAAVDPSEVIRLGADIARGLAHAHEHGILHRDIKPANILLDERLQPKIGDFGLARPADRQVEEGEAIFGTPGYTAPEVLAPPHHVDQRADIFSLGVLLHELLTGRLPEQDRRPPSAISHCDARFDAVVRKATHPNPQLRYQNAAMIADELEKIASSPAPRLLQAAPAAYRPPTAAYAHIKPAKKGGGGMLLTLLVIMALVAAGYHYRAELQELLDPAPAGEAPPAAAADPVGLVPAEESTDPEAAEQLPAVEPELPDDSVVTPDEHSAADSLDGFVDADGPALAAPEVSAAPVVAPSAAPSAAPQVAQFDVPRFLKQARSAMYGKCRAAYDEHAKALKGNRIAYRQEMRRAIRKNLAAMWQGSGEHELEEMLEQMEKNGNRMLSELSNEMKFKDWAVEIHKLFLQKEGEYDRALAGQLALRNQEYIQGLEKRVATLRSGNDPVAADLLQQEVDKAKAAPRHFEGLMGELRDNWTS